MKALFAVITALASLPMFAADDVLIVADEHPAMQYVAGKLKSEENKTAQVVWQTNLPPDLSVYSAVLMYIHRDLKEDAEKALINYAEGGGKLIVLHHSISSGKRKNRDWFKFLGVTLADAEVNAGGYKWIEDISQQIVNLNAKHFITTHKVSYPEKIPFKPDLQGEEQSRPAVTLNKSEVYLNHVLTEDKTRTTLLGFKYTDKDSGKTWMQTHAGWVKPSGKGWVIYLQPGHSLHDLQNPTYERILLNALIWKP